MSATLADNIFIHAGTWKTELPASASPAKLVAVADQGGNKEDSILIPDLRYPADEADYQNNGKYRCKRFYCPHTSAF